MKNIALLFTLFLISCNNNATPDRSSTTVIEEPINNDLILILIDYSKSQDSSNIIAQTKEIFTLIKDISVGATIKILPINNNIYTKPVFEYVRMKNPNKPKELNNWRSEPQLKAIEATRIIKNLYKTKNDGSCVVNGLKALYTYVSTLSEKKNIKTYIFSDLIECCPKLKCGSNKKDFEFMKKNINIYDLDNYALSKYVSYENIRIIPGISKDFNIIGNSKEFLDFWGTVSKKMGYEKVLTISSHL